MEPRQFGRFACMASSKIKIEIRAPKVRTKGIRSKVTNVPVTQDGWRSQLRARQESEPRGPEWSRPITPLRSHVRLSKPSFLQMKPEESERVARQKWPSSTDTRTWRVELFVGGVPDGDLGSRWFKIRFGDKTGVQMVAFSGVESEIPALDTSKL